MKGFTLIEILVSVTLLLLLGGLMIAAYNGFNDSQTVASASLTLRDNLRAARTNAASGVKPAGCDTLLGYVVSFPDASTYTMVASCMVSGAVQNVGATVTYKLPANVTFAGSPSPMTFLPLDQGIAQTQTITLKGLSATTAVRINTSGVVVNATPTP